ncbi:MAG TPA: protein phosphatase [Lachnoclostridium sp.]|jgi:serine/threonine protein phosphatase PrpC|uniref:PP2C family protein-serine/threonine phosphatase n=1 Tax=Lacrimispora sp. TaxID=2719234 RepID=UPI000EC8A44F|nr:protein phosphatase 2C domain-containing protein [Lacrimispora sp.]HCD42753.1 protein phosphatase [Lachnoclostridium sp.]
MTIPETSLLLLGLGGSMLLFIRIMMAVRNPWDMSLKKRSGCESGASKTIGDRELQEDEYGITETEDGIMAVLADGMGKQFGGKIAARTVVQVFLDMFEDKNTFYNPQYSFRRAFQGANREILNQLEENQGSASVAAVMVKERKLYYSTVGNVKVAVYRNQELVPVTSGHTISMLAKQKYKEGKLTRQEAVSLLDHHRLYNYVGQDGFRDVEFFDTPISLYGGEYVLLMTDGLYETVRWKDIEDCLEVEGSSQEKAFAIIELVNKSQKEEKDNAAAVVLQIR